VVSRELGTVSRQYAVGGARSLLSVKSSSRGRRRVHHARRVVDLVPPSNRRKPPISTAAQSRAVPFLSCRTGQSSPGVLHEKSEYRSLGSRCVCRHHARAWGVVALGPGDCGHCRYPGPPSEVTRVVLVNPVPIACPVNRGPAVVQLRTDPSGRTPRWLRWFDVGPSPDGRTKAVSAPSDWLARPSASQDLNKSRFRGTLR
jgi:hypothetical protein